MPSTNRIDVRLDTGKLADALDIVARHAAACAAELRDLAPLATAAPGGEDGERERP